jgi:aminoglycoside phosphotransferase (APT) family kinase protein
LEPFAGIEGRIAAAPAVSAMERSFLLSRLAELSDQFEQLTFALPVGVIHGDASIGNVIRDRAGDPVLIDLDGFAVGPREWDLVLTALYYERFGWHTRDEYLDFAAIYGFDVMQWPEYAVLRDIREFLMVTWLAQKATDDEKAAHEVHRRIETLRTGASRRDWSAY